MKFLFLLSFLILAVCNIRAELTKEEAMAIAIGCKEEAGASDADFEAMIKHEPAETQEDKCMRACAFKKLGVMDDEGKMIKDAAIELSKSLIKHEDKLELAIGVIETCGELEVSDDHCEAAEEYRHCWRNELKSKGASSAEDLI
ncbi:general odorant-binding protein 28a-like [Calliphora vicina]|uniref:general odorant-binding protein 28a-like n=1 Tax=Calliphora vicina TaxID=7373 RepID=UPI00325A98FD